MPLPPNPRDPAAARLSFWLVASLFLGAAALISVSAWTLHQGLHQHRHQAEVTTRNLADTLERNLTGQIRLLDLALREALKGPGQPAALETHRERVPLLERLWLTDAEGRALGGGPDGIQPPNLAHQAFFQSLRTDPEQGLVIASPTATPPGQAPGLTFALARRDAHGRFQGALCGLVPLEALTRTLGIVNVGPHGSIALRDARHGLVSRYPNTRNLGQRLGERATTPEYLQVVESQDGVGSFRKASPVDGLVRTWTVRRVEAYPFWVIVGLAEADYLAPWRRDTFVVGGMALTALLLTLVLGRLCLRLWRRQEAARNQLENLVQDLTLALAEVKALRGMLPICSGCKKIRDDQGYWSQIEAYLSVHTEATFTHGMCPDCVKVYFPDLPHRGRGTHEA